ncbi:MAG: branched-chain amino acid ABC transporter permease [Candidatus Magasanikbacteria bacterium]|nr:branched-chain amino acid ABC transporter permease [Candidatus Magasanikbacteria bacterium]
MFANYLIHILITVGYYLILVLSLNLTLGYSGILNLGHVAFFAVGAYTSAILTKSGLPFVASFLLAGLMGGVFGFFVALFTKRLKGDYIALATLGFSFVVLSFINNLRFLTRGPYGIAGIEKPNIFGWQIHSNVGYLVFVSVMVLLCFLLLYRIVHSRYGSLLQAARDDEIGLSALGKNVFRLRVQVMALSGALASIAGSIFAHYITYIHPSNFFLSDIILIVSMVIVGGLASLRGSVLATFSLIFFTESVRFLPLPPGIVGPARLIIYALLLLLILLYKPRGLFGKIDLQ